MTDLALKHGLSFSDLYERDGLIGLDRAFVAHLAATDIALQARHDKLAPLFSVKRLFVQRRAVKEIKEAEAGALNGHKLGEELETLIGGPPADFGSRQGALAWELR